MADVLCDDDKIVGVLRYKYLYEKLGYRRIGTFLPPEQDADKIMYLKELKP